MGRKIILLSDGTGNAAAKVWRTNVWRTFEALDLSGNDQIAYYDDGVGTSTFKPLALLGGAFGFGLRRNVLELYKFACRNYREPEDELFGFGFSRGAFTIRIVMGLINSQGLVRADNETELHSLASAAYRAYRRERYEHLKLEAPYQWIRNKFGPNYPPEGERKNIKDIKIRFIGVWDTVAAYGMPIKEMSDGIHDYLWPIELPNDKLSKKVMRACQALALDEERTTFHPQLWDETGENSATAKLLDRRSTEDERITQVWFSGVHSNVGGGYPDDSLAYIPFVWMLGEARRCGLKFKSDYANDPINAEVMRADPDTFKSAVSKRDKDGRLYDPRRGFGGYYRYGPRKLVPEFYPEAKKEEDDEVTVGRAKIHESVFKRIANHAHAYAPIGLPPLYDVVKDDGEIVTPDQYSIPPAKHPFESNAAAAFRAQTQEHVWNEVWKRRIIYFLTVGATLWLLIFPLARDAQPVDELKSRFRWISDILHVVQGFLPSNARLWIDGYAREPGLFLFSALLVVVLLYAGGRIAGSTAGKMGAIWRKSAEARKGLPNDWIYRLRSSRAYAGINSVVKSYIAPLVFAAMFAYLGLAIASHLLFNIQDVWGLTCKETPEADARTLKVGDTVILPVDFKTSDFCYSSGVLLGSNGARYIVTIEPKSDWADAGIAVYPGDSPRETASWYEKVLFDLAVPLRRNLFQEWFKLTFRYGSVGGEEAFYKPDPTDPVIQFPLVPTRDGELFVFVNDAVLGIPGLYGWFYRNNRGTARITLRRTK
jgi:uncharacterized protein (DUF2235 family)